MKTIIGILSTLIFCLSCKTKNIKSIVVLDSYAPQKTVIYVNKINYKSGNEEIVDSIIVNAGLFKYELHITDTLKELYSIRVKNSIVKIPFIIDNDLIKVKFDFLKPHLYSFKNSPLNETIRKFIEQQTTISDSINALIKNSSISSENKLKKLINQQTQNYIDFIETSNNPNIVFLFYDNINFDNDIKKQESFVNTVYSKFSKHMGIKKIKEEFDTYKRVLDIEYNVGEKLPTIILPNKQKELFNTQQLNGKIYVINFWNTACLKCQPYFTLYKNNRNIFDTSKINIVTVALDNDKESWETILNNNKESFQYINLIDTLIWKGEVAKKLCIDSIPFNFLISKDGVILSKAMKSETMLDTIKKYLYNK